MKRSRITWIAATIASAALMFAGGLWIGGLNADPARAAASPVAAVPAAKAPAATPTPQAANYVVKRVLDIPGPMRPGDWHWDETGAPKDGLLQALIRQFPSSSVIEVGNVLRQARELLTQVSTAILAAASVAVLAGVAVLLGAIAAARSSRLYDNVILRVLGASRRQLLLLQLAEYGLLAVLLAGVALVLGSAMAWLVIVQLFEFDWLPNWGQVLGVLGAGLGLVILFALGGAIPLLRAKPAQALREL